MIGIIGESKVNRKWEKDFELIAETSEDKEEVYHSLLSNIIRKKFLKVDTIKSIKLAAYDEDTCIYTFVVNFDDETRMVYKVDLF